MLEGAGVHLQRAFGYQQAPRLDPFLLLDDFHSDDPDDYIQGFPWHPHRGIETITYVLHGEIEHGDSLGNAGVIASGDVQWMTAGSGIIHQEMPKGRDDGLLWGFQLWANLPSSHKMMPPRYRDVTRQQIPEVELDGIKIKVISGAVGDVRGPVQDVVIEPEYLDVAVPSQATFTRRVAAGHTVLAYVIQGQGYFGLLRTDGGNPIGPETLVVYGDGEEVSIAARDGGVRFLLISGRPIGEPVAWRGPIVMNTQEELRIAFEEYQRGTFLKHSAA
jgi:redox-sensitive bicupin YhaK (pirin superfamily)